MTTPIPVTRLDNEATWAAVESRIRDLVLRGAFTLGPELLEFEQAAAAAFGCSWAVGTSSGTSALVLALRAAPLAPGSRVAVPANTFYATFEAIIAAGHVPVVIDHDDDYLIALDALETLDLDAVVPVHLYGLPVDMIALTELASQRGWWVLEDCSQAHGATVDGRPVGSFGGAGAFSAYPTKNLGAWGDAGFVTGNDPSIEARIRALRHHGQYEGNVHEEIGGTERLDNLQAVVLTEKLRHLATEFAARRQVAAWYRSGLADTGLALPDDAVSPSRGQVRRHAFHQFVIRFDDRDRLREVLADQGIGTGIHYPVPVHLQPASKDRCEIPERPVKAESWADEIVSLPMYPSLQEADADRVCAAIRSFLGTR